MADIPLGEVELIPRASAYAFVQEHHYSRVLPRLTKIVLGARDTGGEIAAVLTLGWGVRPVHTIAKAFPGLGTADYYEIGKMCLRDDMPRNSESWFLSRIIAWLRENSPDTRLLYTWADGILGKPGYVYQAANFFYGGYIVTEIYLDADGRKVHPRSMQGLSEEAGRGKMASRALSVTRSMGYEKFWGKQFRYVFPLCEKREWKRLAKLSPFDWKRSDYPKDADCTYEKQVESGREPVDKLPFVKGDYVRKGQPTLF